MTTRSLTVAAALGLLMVVMVGSATWWLGSSGAPDSIEAPVLHVEDYLEDVALGEPSAEREPESVRVQDVELRRGDTLVKALIREGLGVQAAHEVAVALADGGANLRRMQPGHPLEIVRDLEGRPTAVRYEPTPWLRIAAVATDGGWEAQRTEVEPDVRVEAVQGTVTRSLFHGMEEAGEAAILTIRFAEIFESEFDFTADTREGDRFRLLVEKRYAGETFVEYGRILAAQYASDGRLITGVGYQPGKRFAYYDLDGRSLKKTFLRAPLEFTRISSGFTYRRPHPVLGGVRPHLAIDYAAPTGTPVWAVADGVVAFAGWKGGNGIQVHLRHTAGYETFYNHLSRVARGVRPGARVRQRQVIGYVGSTGLATGPHLDYRVRKRGRFVNPLSEKFLPGEPLPERQRGAYLAQARELVRQLEAEAPF